jgi:hypothetical protein
VDPTWFLTPHQPRCDGEENDGIGWGGGGRITNVLLVQFSVPKSGHIVLQTFPSLLQSKLAYLALSLCPTKWVTNATEVAHEFCWLASCPSLHGKLQVVLRKHKCYCSFPSLSHWAPPTLPCSSQSHLKPPPWTSDTSLERRAAALRNFWGLGLELFNHIPSLSPVPDPYNQPLQKPSETRIFKTHSSHITCSFFCFCFFFPHFLSGQL